MSTTVDKLMALADQHAIYPCDTTYCALRAAIVEALDPGEPVVFISAAWLKALHRGHRGELSGMSKLPFQDAQPLYARSKT